MVNTLGLVLKSTPLTNTIKILIYSVRLYKKYYVEKMNYKLLFQLSFPIAFVQFYYYLF